MLLHISHGKELCHLATNRPYHSHYACPNDMSWALLFVCMQKTKTGTALAIMKLRGKEREGKGDSVF